MSDHNHHHHNHDDDHHHHHHHHHEHHQHEHHQTKVEQNQHAFDKRADQYDTDETIAASKKVYDILFSQIGSQVVPTTTKVLNFGCGTGLLEEHLRHNVHSIIGIDISDGMIQQYKKKIEQNNWTNVTGYQLDIVTDTMPFEEESFDIIVSCFVLHHVSDIETIGTKLIKYLKPGGIICLFELRKESDTDKTVDNLLQQADVTTKQSLGQHHGFTTEQLQNYFVTTLGLTSFVSYNPGTIIHRKNELPIIYVQATK